MSRKYITDRGPGYGAVSALSAEDVPAIRDMSRSWEGQDKATVESTHARHTKLNGAPNYFQSELTAFQLVKREILLASADNHKKDCSDRLTPEMVAARVPANPNGMVRYLMDRGRVDAVTMPLDRAIRGLLKEAWFTLDAAGLWLYQWRYASDAFNCCKFAECPLGKQQIRLRGYVAPMSVRLAWVEVEGRLIEVSAELPIRDDPEQLLITLADLEELDVEQRKLKREQRTAKTTAGVVVRDRFTRATGKQWNAGEVKSGRPPARGARSAADQLPTQYSQRRT